jgi:hypothetical protein
VIRASREKVDRERYKLSQKGKNRGESSEISGRCRDESEATDEKDK